MVLVAFLFLCVYDGKDVALDEPISFEYQSNLKNVGRMTTFLIGKFVPLTNTEQKQKRKLEKRSRSILIYIQFFSCLLLEEKRMIMNGRIHLSYRANCCDVIHDLIP